MQEGHVFTPRPPVENIPFLVPLRTQPLFLKLLKGLRSPLVLIFRIKRIEIKHPPGLSISKEAWMMFWRVVRLGMTISVQQGDRIEGGFRHEFRWMTQGCHLYIEATSGSLRRHLFAHVHTFHGVTEP